MSVDDKWKNLSFSLRASLLEDHIDGLQTAAQEIRASIEQGRGAAALEKLGKLASELRYARETILNKQGV